MDDIPTGIDHMLRTCSPDDPRLVEAMLRTYADYIFQLSLSILRDRDEAKDATQETFLAAAEHLRRYQPGTNFKAWLSQIAVNRCRGVLRKRKSQQALQQTLQILHSLVSRSPGPEEAAIQSEARSELWAAVDALDEKHRLPVILHYVNEIPTAEVAQILGLSRGTVHSRLHYACQQLQGSLRRSGFTSGAAYSAPRQPSSPVSPNGSLQEEVTP